MLFCSTEFIYYFFPVVIIVYYSFSFLKQKIWARVWLVGSSLFFYGYWKPIYLPVIVVSVLVNYFISKAIMNQEGNDGKKAGMMLFSGIVFNVCLLGYFKYFDFFIANFSELLAIERPFQLNLLLPLGISFFTFQQIAYLIDCKKGALTRGSNILEYFLFVTFFPQLIAGPIVRHSEMIHQFRNDRNPFFQLDNIAKGIFLFSVGFFKKIVLADNLSIWVDKAFSHINQLTMIDAWCSSLSFTFQVYFDFSGYTDMAIGLALFFGISLPANFDSPYKAVNIQDFWRRWHITLSKWFRDYLYVPLGGNRVPWARNHINLIIVFIVGGIWHGAGWTFVVWGLLNGVAIVVHRIWNRFEIEMPRMMARLMTFLFINLTLAIFRSPDLQSAKTFIEKMFVFSDVGITQSLSQFLSNLTGWRFFTFIVVPETPTNIIKDPVPLICFLLLNIVIVNCFNNSETIAKNMNNAGALSLLLLSLFSAVIFLTALAFTYLVPPFSFLYFNF